MSAELDTICIHCGQPRSRWRGPCPDAPRGYHWTATERIVYLEGQVGAYEERLRMSNRLLLAAAGAIEQARTAKWNRGRRRRRALRAMIGPDELELQAEAAKISDTVAVYTGDPSLPVGEMFDQLEGRS